MGVQRQVVGEQVDAAVDQAGHPLEQPAGQPPVLAAPEQAVVDDQRIGARLGRGLDQREAGGDAADDPPHLRTALDLQAVRTIILETIHGEPVTQVGVEFLSMDHVGTARCTRSG
jgi:hypothetical protein